MFQFYGGISSELLSTIFLFIWDRVSLCTFGCPGNLYVIKLSWKSQSFTLPSDVLAYMCAPPCPYFLFFLKSVILKFCWCIVNNVILLAGLSVCITRHFSCNAIFYSVSVTTSSFFSVSFYNELVIAFEILWPVL